MARRYLVRDLAAGRRRLPPDLGHHLARVMRLRAGSSVRLFDGRGHEADARVLAVAAPGSGGVEVEIADPQPVRRESACAVHLAFAVPKGARADWLFEHGTEVGVHRFLPLRLARSAGGDGGAARLARWRRIVEAAATQCDRTWLPDVLAPATLADLLARDDLPGERLLMTAGAPPPIRAARTAALVLVGPEGGLTEGERAELAQAGFAAAGLGPLTLRTETAAVVAAAVLAALAADGHGTPCTAPSANE